MTAADERHLLREARMGNQQAFGRLVEVHMKPAYNLAYRFVNDHHQAEEIVQDAFVRAFRSLRSFRGDAGFGTWMHRIVVNLSLNAVRSRSRNRLRFESPSGEPADRTNGSSPQPEDLMTASHLHGALECLPGLQRKVVILRHIEGYSTREVSQILECSEGTVKTHLFRGLKKLREKLGFLKEERL